MTLPTPRRLLGAAALIVAALGAAVPVTGGPTPDPRACGLTTLDATIVPDPAKPGTLKCGPGITLTVREDLGTKAKAARTSIRDALISFAAFTDFQLVDEESPLRGEFLDKCGENPLKAAFRWQESMGAALINSHVQTANLINATTGGPQTNRPFDFAVQLGDAADNQQWNEVRWFMTLLDGSADPSGKVHLVDSDSGANGYEGVQGKDPISTPVTGKTVRDLANEPFYAPGLRNPDGSPLPWYSVMGNHDMKVNGTIPNDEAWKAFARAWVTGSLKVTDLPPDDQQRACADPTVLTDSMFWSGVAASGHTKIIEADPDRRLLDRNGWIAEHLPHDEATTLDANATGSYGLPAGHGFAANNRCKDASGGMLERACYAFDVAGDPKLPTPIALRFIALDTTDDDGTDDGNLDQAQLDWLTRDLIAHSSTYYDADGTKHTTSNKDSLVVVFSHHSVSRMTNTYSTEDRYTGADLEALFHRFPNVILHANGHTHFNKIWAHPDGSGRTGGYWEVNTSAISDWPHQSRTIEIADNHDGTLSIFGVNFDAAVAPDPRTIPWGSDATPERSLTSSLAPGQSVTANTNEAWLASAAREVGSRDPQSGAATPYTTEISPPADKPEDKNVELIIANPFGVTEPTPGPPPSRCPPGVDCKVFGYRPPPFFGIPRFPIPRFPTIPPTFPQQFPRAYTSTGPGLGSPAADRPYIPASEGTLLLLAAGGAVWLYRARIRSWMLGR